MCYIDCIIISPTTYVLDISLHCGKTEDCHVAKMKDARCGGGSVRRIYEKELEEGEAGVADQPARFHPIF